jgi:O-antigen ligase
VALLAGRFTLDRVGLEVPVLNDPRVVLFWMLLSLLAVELRAVRWDAGPHAVLARRSLYLVLAFFGYQAVSALWTPPGGRLAQGVTDLAAMSFLVWVYWVLSRWDRDRVVRLTLTFFLVAGFVYFVVAAMGYGHDPSGRWAALGGGSNVFVRIMVLAAAASVYFYLRGGGRLVWLLPLPVFAGGALMSGSRGGLLAAAGTVFLLLVTGLRRVRVARLVQAAAVGAVLAGVTWYVAGPQLAATVQDRFLRQTVQQGYASGRDVLFAQALRMFGDYPVVGTGLDGFYASIRGFSTEQYVHSLPLAVAAEGGAVGLLLLAAAMYGLFASYTAVPRPARTLESRIAAYCGIFVGLASFFSGGYYDTRLMWMFLVMAAIAPPRRDAVDTSAEDLPADQLTRTGGPP